MKQGPRGGEPPEQPTIEHGSTVLRRRPRVRWTDARGAHERILEGRTLCGSAPDAGLPLADRTISRLHAELDPRDDGLWVRDLGSRNGTFIDDVRVESGRAPPGGKVRLGSTVLVVSYDAEPAAVELWSSERFGPLLGRSPAMRELFARLARVAPTDSSVLIHGETGTGKELVARAIHEASPRAGGPFVIVDCAALPENLLEAELFGHARGAFTGAASARAGAFEEAEGGTVFLDEIGELPLAVQPKLLRVLESRQVRRLGETAHRAVDVRFVSATHRDLRTMVNAGAFREDLYFRLAVLVVALPPLRQRPEDIPLLVEHMLRGDASSIGPGPMRELVGRPWLGNVRELRNFVERARALGPHEALAMTPAAAKPEAPGAEPSSVPLDLDRPYKELREESLDAFERRYVTELLARHGRNVAAAAQAAGLDRTYIYRLIRKHDL
jgi:two-component system response regulator GlrR